MRTTHPVRLATALAILLATGACNEPFSPSPNSPSLGGLTVVPRSATIHSGQVVALRATLRDEFGIAVQTEAITWTSSNESVATVGASGEVMGRSQGLASITASAQGRTQASAIRVLPKQSKPAPKPGLE